MSVLREGDSINFQKGKSAKRLALRKSFLFTQGSWNSLRIKFTNTKFSYFCFKMHLASCTLDGCVKVYTSRVDSVATETTKLLGGLATSASKFGFSCNHGRCNSGVYSFRRYSQVC